MAVDWMDGPDHYGTDTSLLTQGPYAEAAQVQLVANSGPNGIGTVLRTFNVGGGQLRKVLSGNRDAVGVGQRIFTGALPGANNQWILNQWNNAANQPIATMFVQSTGALSVQTGGGGAGSFEVWNSGPVIVGQSWQHVEAFLQPGTANDGALRVNVNSLPVTAQAGITTSQIAGPVAQIAWHGGAFSNWLFRDIYLWDTTGAVNNAGMQGDREILTSFADNDGAVQDWDYSVGASGWPLISNNPPDDSQFIFADSAGDLSDFGIDPIDTAITSISAVRIAARAWKSDAGVGTISLGMVSSGTKTAVNEQAISTEPTYYSQIEQLDPHTAARWSPTSLNAALVELNRVQ